MSKEVIINLQAELDSKNVTLVAVSKTKPLTAISEVYKYGIRNFGENRVQEMVEKQPMLPEDIKWHMIGNLQKNKVKYIAPFVHLIHSVSSLSLLNVINKEGKKNDRIIDILLQIKIADEAEKSGMPMHEAETVLKEIQDAHYKHIGLKGFMGMATFTDDKEQIRSEFRRLRVDAAMLYERYNKAFSRKDDWAHDYEISMGMSGDYEIAIEEGSTMVRIGSLIFGARS